jgi:hypothetical protein
MSKYGEDMVSMITRDQAIEFAEVARRLCGTRLEESAGHGVDGGTSIMFRCETREVIIALPRDGATDSAVCFVARGGEQHPVSSPEGLATWLRGDSADG